MPQVQKVATATWRVTPDPMFISDRDGRLVAVNPACSSVLGWSEDEMLNASFRDFVHPDDAARSEAAFGELLAGHPVLRFENRYRTKSGDYAWLSWVAVPEGDYFFCSGRDVTEDKRRDQKIEDQAKDALLRQQFLAILGHDLRSPLAAVTAGVRLLSRQDQSEQSREVLRNMAASTRRMSELIENLMDLARIQLGGGITIERAPVDDLDARISQIAGEIGSAHGAIEIRVDIDIPDRVHCDAPRLMQVVSNLLGNAVTHGETEQPIDLRVSHAEGRLNIEVCNAGVPIPESNRETLFQPFFKGMGEGDRASPQGLGLGLFICWEIVAAHEGTIHVTSDETETCFIVDIPA